MIFAKAAGLSDAEIERIAFGPDAPEWFERDRALLHTADKLHHTHDLGDATCKQLAATWNDAQLVEIPFVVGHCKTSADYE